MVATTVKPTRREQRRAETVREIKALAMEQVSRGGPDALSLSGIVREMSMSPAAVYRYFDNRDALLADLVVDAYNELADFLVAIERGTGSAGEHLTAVLRGTRDWALEHPNSYLLTFQTSIGSGQEFARERTIPAASRSMTVLVDALAAAADALQEPTKAIPLSTANAELQEAIRAWAKRSALDDFPPAVLTLAVLSWTRLHGIISLELGGHLSAAGISAAALFESEITTIARHISDPPPARRPAAAVPTVEGTGETGRGEPGEPFPKARSGDPQAVPSGRA